MLAWLLLIVKDKTFSIKRLSRMIFGKSSESLKNLKERLKNNENDSSPSKENETDDDPNPPVNITPFNENINKSDVTSTSNENPANNNSLSGADAANENTDKNNTETTTSNENPANNNSLSSTDVANENTDKNSTGDTTSNENLISNDLNTPSNKNVTNNDSNTASTTDNETGKQSQSNTSTKDPKAPNPDPSNKKKNRGHHSLNDYLGSRFITYILHTDLKCGDICPGCGQGPINNYDPELILTIQGEPSLNGTIWAAQGFRCGACGAIFRAVFPKEVITQPRADFSAKAIVCISKYQLGLPLYRLETWQTLQHFPISDSEMWEWTESVAMILQPIHQALIKIAANSNVIHNDDTTAKVLDLMKENAKIKKELEEQAKNGSKNKEKPRVGIYTTALLAIQDDHEIAIYVTGRKNAGENLDDLLDHRSKDLKRPIQSCDASSQNTPERHNTDIAKCFNHARHNFCEILECWPKECLTIIELMNIIFVNDRITKKMSPDDRQKYHEKNSGPIMEKIKSYTGNLISDKVVEPNCNLGKAIAYLNNHWKGLSLFLTDGEAPLTNNSCERIIKSKVLIRKNSYFYKSEWGAMVGDVLLSAINTCKLNDINAYDYLIAIQANENKISKNPQDWLPWNYMQNSTCPYINASFIPKEQTYQKSATGNPIIMPLPSNPKEMTIRERCKGFFKKYTEEPKPASVLS